MKNLILMILVQSAILWSQTISHSNVQHLGYLDSLVEIQDYFGLKRTFEENKNQLSESDKFPPEKKQTPPFLDCPRLLS